MPTDYLRQTHHEFDAASRDAMASPHLKGILNQLGDNSREYTERTWKDFPAGDALRTKARKIKDETLAHLNEHLATLADSVERQGGKVHWAATGEEACEIVQSILAAADAKKVVKAKSMTTEEIHLNESLQAAEIEVTETDLGEYIVQLAGHRPSHVVGPALHLSVDEVADILGRDVDEILPSDRVLLTAHARRILRQRFAEADAGISGVNFAVAETGSIALISNEGNIDLSTSLPKTHIAVMGIEKVLPTLDDLPTFLQLLPRAASGIKMPSYTTIISGPKQPGDPNGPEAFHLVILDNGRSEILAGPLRESLFCIRCGACLNACPVYRTVGGHAYGGVYAGPIGAVLTPLYDGLADNQPLPHASSLCGACREACPVKIAIPDMLVQLREQLHETPQGVSGGESFVYRLGAMVLKRPWLYRMATWMSSRWLGRDGSTSNWWKRLPGLGSGWTKSRDFPPPAKQRFRDLWRETES